MKNFRLAVPALAGAALVSLAAVGLATVGLAAMGLAVPVSAAAGADSPAAASKPDGSAPARYTFSWPLESTAPAPRGGSTRGAPVTPETQASSEWLAIQEQGLSAFERDRRAVLTLAGEYRVTFDFLDVASFKSNTPRGRPYQSWGTERVFVDRDTGTFISLVHILDMRIVQGDGKISDPMVSKHWREDWRYEPASMLEFQGRDRWLRRALSRSEREHRWSQTVYQVDESPRYSSVGRWDHSASFSTWIGGDTWRPLPTRELSVRNDYDVLAGTNRITLRPTGWMQEENNLKMVLALNNQPDPALPYVAREYGVAQYERLRDADFAASSRYYTGTKAYWGAVYDAWQRAFQTNTAVTLHRKEGDSKAVDALFARADAIVQSGDPDRAAPELIEAALRESGVASSR